MRSSILTVKGRVNVARQRTHALSSAVFNWPSISRQSMPRVKLMSPRTKCKKRSVPRVTASISRRTTSRVPMGAFKRCETLKRIRTPLVKKRQQPRGRPLYCWVPHPDPCPKLANYSTVNTLRQAICPLGCFRQNYVKRPSFTAIAAPSAVLACGSRGPAFHCHRLTVRDCR